RWPRPGAGPLAPSRRRAAGPVPPARRSRHALTLASESRRHGRRDTGTEHGVRGATGRLDKVARPYAFGNAERMEDAVRATTFRVSVCRAVQARDASLGPLARKACGLTRMPPSEGAGGHQDR